MIGEDREEERLRAFILPDLEYDGVCTDVLYPILKRVIK